MAPTWKKLQCVASCSQYLPLYCENHQWVLQMNRAGVDLYPRHSLLHPCQCSTVPPLLEKAPSANISGIFHLNYYIPQSLE